MFQVPCPIVVRKAKSSVRLDEIELLRKKDGLSKVFVVSFLNVLVQKVLEEVDDVWFRVDDVGGDCVCVRFGYVDDQESYSVRAVCKVFESCDGEHIVVLSMSTMIHEPSVSYSDEEFDVTLRVYSSDVQFVEHVVAELLRYLGIDLSCLVYRKYMHGINRIDLAKAITRKIRRLVKQHNREIAERLDLDRKYLRLVSLLQ